MITGAAGPPIRYPLGQINRQLNADVFIPCAPAFLNCQNRLAPILINSARTVVLKR